MLGHHHKHFMNATFLFVLFPKNLNIFFAVRNEYVLVSDKLCLGALSKKRSTILLKQIKINKKLCIYLIAYFFYVENSFHTIEVRTWGLLDTWGNRLLHFLGITYIVPELSTSKNVCNTFQL